MYKQGNHTGPILISIIIPVKNGAPWLHDVLNSIFKQTLITQTEVIAIDSGSTDTTLEILTQYPVRVITIDPATFNHGETRNLGVREAVGEYVVMTVQDAKPQNEHWLQHLLDGFSDQSVAGVCGAQIVPHEIDKNPVDWFRPVSLPQKKKFHFPSAEEFRLLSPDRKKEICSWDDVNAMYRRDVLVKLPFRKVSFAEDALWAKDALENGYSIVYNPEARVLHYHHEMPEYTLRRSFTVYYHFYKFFGVKPALKREGMLKILRQCKLLLLETKIGFRSKLKWMIYNYRQQKAAKLAVLTFYEALQKGEAELDKMHAKICSVTPQASKTVFK